MSDYKPVIGLEIHVELKTLSKMFCGCKNDPFHAKEPNSYTCPVCLGMPGALPVPNRKAIEWTVLIGKALNCKINSVSKFDRKHYFYPDLPKGYQISQYDEPIASQGWLNIKDQKSNIKDKNNTEKKIRIHRVHLEEDTGKLIHSGSETLVDFNRSGVPLVEIVTEPDFDNSDDVKRFLEELHTIIKYLEVSDANMEEGSMRLEPNISVREISSDAKRHPEFISGSESKKQMLNQATVLSDNERIQHDKQGLPKYKVEVKNINSFNFVKKAIDYEVTRHIELLEQGKIPAQETRGYVEKTNSTISQRSKEEAHDYRYFPEPDIPPMIFSQEYIDSVRIPELPQQKLTKYKTQYKVKFQDAWLISRDYKLANKFEEVVNDNNIKVQKISPQEIANLLINKFRNRLSIMKTTSALKQEILAQKKLKKDLEKLFNKDKKELDQCILHIIEVNKVAVNDFKKGKENAIMFLVGQVMREMKGKANPIKVKEELLKKLKKE